MTVTVWSQDSLNGSGYVELLFEHNVINIMFLYFLFIYILMEESKPW